MTIFTTTTPALCREPFAPIFQSFKNVNFHNVETILRPWVKSAITLAKTLAGIGLIFGAFCLPEFL